MAGGTVLVSVNGDVVTRYFREPWPPFSRYRTHIGQIKADAVRAKAAGLFATLPPPTCRLPNPVKIG